MATTISANMIADSISPDGVRITTMHLRYPRMIHAEFMTHRVFSRNARSSRAVPVKTMLDEIINDPVIPIAWGANQRGMQAGEECNEQIILKTYPPLYREEAWLEARDRAVDIAMSFNDAGYHKQIVNRLLEPFMHIDTLVTATEWSNFFALRDHHMAEPHIQVLAQVMKKCMDESTPETLKDGEWHLPYISEGDKFAYEDNDKTIIKLSVARCARISYAPFDGDASIEKELERYNLLVGSHPMHASPAEHQATPDTGNHHWFNQGNFRGWIQYRKTLKGENQ